MSDSSNPLTRALGPRRTGCRPSSRIRASSTSEPALRAGDGRRTRRELAAHRRSQAEPPSFENTRRGASTAAGRDAQRALASALLQPHRLRRRTPALQAVQRDDGRADGGALDSAVYMNAAPCSPGSVRCTPGATHWASILRAAAACSSACTWISCAAGAKPGRATGRRSATAEVMEQLAAEPPRCFGQNVLHDENVLPAGAARRGRTGRACPTSCARRRARRLRDRGLPRPGM